MSTRRLGSPTCWPACRITPPSAFTNFCRGTGTRNTSPPKLLEPSGRHPTPNYPMAFAGWIRWCSDGFEISCWNGDLVRLAFIIDAHDREIIAWHAVANAGISGSMVRDMMLEAVKSRFAAIQAPHALEWLTDNGSVYTAHETRAFATALNLVPCFTPIQSPESNGIS